MITYYPKNSLVINRVLNGFIVKAKYNREYQEDGIDGDYVFNDFKDMTKWMDKYYKTKPLSVHQEE